MLNTILLVSNRDSLVAEISDSEWASLASPPLEVPFDRFIILSLGWLPATALTLGQMPPLVYAPSLILP